MKKLQEIVADFLRYELALDQVRGTKNFVVGKIRGRDNIDTARGAYDCVNLVVKYGMLALQTYVSWTILKAASTERNNLEILLILEGITIVVPEVAKYLIQKIGQELRYNTIEEEITKVKMPSSSIH